jgi:hypothetical protein
MHHNSPDSVAALDVPAKNRRGGFMSKKRSAYVGVLAGLVGAMAFVPVASAHTLTRAEADSSARWVAQQKVNDPRTPYIFSTAVCDADGVPHIRGCTLFYDTPASRPTANWACTERIQIYYKPHNAGDPPPNYTRYWTARSLETGQYFTHPC